MPTEDGPAESPRPTADPRYAWVMLPVAIAMQVGTSPGQTFGVALFNEPIRESLGLSHTELTGAYLIASLLAATPLMWLGKRMDRHGLKGVTLALVAAIGLSCMAISQVRGVVSLTACLFALRAFGQGGLALAAGNTLGMWFHKRLGFASGVAGVGMSCAVAIVPLGFHALIEQLGWRNAYATIGLVLLATLLPLVAMAYRNNDQDISSAAGVDSLDANAARSLTLRQALRTPAYWIASACTALVGLIITAIVFNLVTMCQLRGFDAAAAASLFPTVAISMALMQFKGGVLADHAPLRVLMAAAIASIGVGVLVTGYAGTMPLAHVGAAMLGAGQGLMAVTGNTLWPRYFGRLELGAIRSSVWTATVAACSAGPFLMGLTLDLTGGYGPSLWLFAALAAAGAIASLAGATPPEVTPHEVDEQHCSELSTGLAC